MPQPYEVTDRRAADALRRGASYLRPFVFEDCTVGRAAAFLGEPIQRTHYWVRLLHQAGLLALVREEPRAGRALKVYRAVAAQYRVTPELLPPGRFAAETQREATALNTAFQETVPQLVNDQELWVTFTPDRRAGSSDYVPQGRGAPGQGGEEPLTSAFWTSRTLTLATAQAMAFKRDVFALLDRYALLAEESPPGEGAHRLFVAFVPERER